VCPGQTIDSILPAMMANQGFGEIDSPVQQFPSFLLVTNRVKKAYLLIGGIPGPLIDNFGSLNIQETVCREMN